MLLMAKQKAEPTAFGVKLKERRVAVGMTQNALAEAVGMKRAQLAALETSPAANPTLDTVRKLAEALGCTVADLVA